VWVEGAVREADVEGCDAAEGGAVIALAILNPRLPATYEAARAALARCEAIDDAQDMANKAEALAVYARQSKDDSLVIMAQRIQARAIRRCGELLKQIPGRPGKNTEDTKPLTLGARAAAAGMSVHQRITATRVAALPIAQFEARVEATQPATVTELANAGRKKLGRPKKDAARCPTCGHVL
jgi:hypothetical protein